MLEQVENGLSLDREALVRYSVVKSSLWLCLLPGIHGKYSAYGVLKRECLWHHRMLNSVPSNVLGRE